MREVSIVVKCPKCQESDNVVVSYSGFKKWQNGTLPIQIALPELSISDREKLMTGWCDKCWDSILGEEENS